MVNDQNRRAIPANTCTSGAPRERPRLTPPSTCPSRPTRYVSPPLHVATCAPSPAAEVNSTKPPSLPAISCPTVTVSPPHRAIIAAARVAQLDQSHRLTLPAAPELKRHRQCERALARPVTDTARRRRPLEIRHQSPRQRPAVVAPEVELPPHRRVAEAGAFFFRPDAGLLGLALPRRYEYAQLETRRQPEAQVERRHRTTRRAHPVEPVPRPVRKIHFHLHAPRIDGQRTLRRIRPVRRQLPQQRIRRGIEKRKPALVGPLRGRRRRPGQTGAHQPAGGGMTNEGSAEAMRHHAGGYGS